ncbi:MAG: glycosyltransferase [Anaerolineales bacterium]
MNTKVPIIMDGYDPHAVETLSLFAGYPTQIQRHQERERILSLQCLAGDFFICASERQRTWWLGLLEAHGRVNPYTFDADPALRNLIDVVPFALPSKSFPRTQINIPEISTDDKVLLWGGGIWEWLDPLTVIRAMPRILEDSPQAKLLFPGTRHPNPAVPAMRKVEEAQALVAELQLQDAVIFGDWVPREAWNAYLARADVGLSLHPDTYETHLAYRSRLLDYIWAGLPMVVTRGDETSKLVSRFQLGRVVDYEDVAGVAAAVSDVLARPKTAFSAGFTDARQALTWEQAAQPLIAFCRAPRRAPDKAALGDRLGNHYYEQKLQALRAERARLTRQQAHLQALISGYEQGKFIRLMKWMRSLMRRG